MPWILPTYRRPDRCAEVIRCINYVGCSTPGIVVVNGMDDYQEYQKINLPKDWKMVFLPQNIGCCGAMNWAFHNYPNEPFYGLLCDDEYIYSSGWDTALVAAAGKNRIAHANDRWQSGKRQHLFVTFGGDLLRELGWWALPGLWHWYHDNVFESLSDGLDISRFCSDIIGEHKHYLAGKAEKDYTYQSGESRNGLDQLVFQHWMINEYPLLKRKLAKFYDMENENGQGKSIDQAGQKTDEPPRQG